MTFLQVCLENNVDGFHSDATVKQLAHFSCHLIVVMFSRYSCSFLMFLNEPKSASSPRQGGKEGHPSLTPLICLRSGIWSECMFAFFIMLPPLIHFTGNGPSLHRQLPEWLTGPGAEALSTRGQRWLGHTGFRICGGCGKALGPKSMAINTHQLVWGAPQSAFST